MSKRRSISITARLCAALAAGALSSTGVGLEGAATAMAAPPLLTSRVFATGASVMHPTPHGEAVVSGPDDITFLGGDIFVGFQNGVGPQGQASPTGNRDSTIVEFDMNGHVVRHWDILGKCDGLTGDPLTGQLIATVNEDAHSSIYQLEPMTDEMVHFSYSEPLPSDGGTDAVSIYKGTVLVSASAPGTTGKAAPRPGYPAVYEVTFHPATRLASLRPLFFDEAKATVANRGGPSAGKTVQLALTDPDSNEVVPGYASRFAGDFMLTSQGDREQVYVHDPAGADQALSVLKLSGSVDDSAWPSGPTGAIYTTDNSGNTVYKITGPFQRGTMFVADTPCDANNAPGKCPARGFPANFLGQLDQATGQISRVPLRGPSPAAQGMLYLP